MIRAADADDRQSLAMLLAAVAEEGDGIAAEPPVDVEKLAEGWRIDGTLVALAGGELVGEIRVDPSWMGRTRASLGMAGAGSPGVVP